MSLPWKDTVRNFLNIYRQARVEYIKDFDREEEKYERVQNIRDIRQKRLADAERFQKSRTLNNDVLIDDLLEQIVVLYKKILPFNLDYVADNLEQIIMFKLPQTFACSKIDFTDDELKEICQKVYPDMNRLIRMTESARTYYNSLRKYRDKANKILPGFGYDMLNKMAESDKHDAISYAVIYGQMDALIDTVAYTPDNQCASMSDYRKMVQGGREVKIDAISAVIDSEDYSKAVMMQNKFWITEIDQYNERAITISLILDEGLEKTDIASTVEKGKVLVKEKRDKNDVLSGIKAKYCRN